VPSIATGASTLVAFPAASVTVSRMGYWPSGSGAANWSARPLAFWHGTL
jgi:hypothetical protein